ncbi:hypothetical protein C8R45DRAFT_756072, partial [Mycena sanguinolenta]
PLLPWLVSSAPCEHSFSSLRDVSDDFTFQEAILIVPKLRAKMQAALRATVKTSDLKKQASGYSHTYFTNEDINFGLLGQYPTDLELSVAYEIAMEENNCLWSLLGIHPQDIAAAPDPGVAVTAQSEPDPEFEALYLDEETDPIETGEPTPAEQLQQVIDGLKQAVNISCAGNEELDTCVMASVALAMEELAKMYVPPTSPDMPPPPSSKPLLDISSNDLVPLVELRRQHQTREEQMGVRTYKGSGMYKNHKTGVEKPLTERQIMAQKMQEIVRRDQERGSSTTLNRTVRWTGSTGIVSTTAKTGNAANAELAAGSRAKNTMKRRRTIFGKVKCISRVAEAGIGSTSPLVTGMYGFVMLGSEIFLALVITMYSRTGGKAGAHAWVPSCDNIGSLSYMIVQLYQYSYRHQFKISNRNYAILGTLRFAHLPSNSFL